MRRDWTVSWEGRWFQIEREHERLSLADRLITVRSLRSGQIQLVHQGRKLRWKELPQRPAATRKVPYRVERTPQVKPAPDHPWRRLALAGAR